ncbi:MAG TPA: SusD/RagB family nutrient-binding outer membrane lipoprotein [Ferruginibacter sp.]|nr:SusD/RagB family nutrient-binding outer membrane lipoprotein [Ferruginibacter sp.]HPH89400.1 SusD/RagB family nutrient-binding outer membrane lipoprotein [Ferruginibacter sp.]
MKQANRKIIFGVLAAVMILSGCKKFLDVNDDPNRVTDDNITPELIFTQAAVTSGIRVVGGQAGGEGGKTDVQFAMNWVGYMSGTGDFALDGEESSYNIGFAFADNSWQRDYALLFSLYQVKTKALARNNELLAGAAMILSAKFFQELTDAFGDIPYSQAFQTNLYPRPAYDKPQDIYAALQASLDSAIAYMDNDVTIAFTNADIVNHGDTDKWIHLANTLKLRLLIRQSEVAGFNPAAEIAKIQANGGVLGAGESVSVNPGYSNSQNKQSPFYGNYGYGTTGNIIAAGIAANEYILNILLSTQDPRVERFFEAVGGNYVGCVYGLSAGNPFGNQSSYFGPGLNAGAEQDQWLMPSFESLFFKAEAIARGWMPGDAQSALNEAITESFVWLGVENATTAAADYIAANPDVTDLSNAGATATDRARFIAVQKYIAMCCIDPREAWADIRRLDMLEDRAYISVNPARLQDRLPVRLLYPQREYTTNGESVLKLGTINQFTSKLFWQQ